MRLTATRIATLFKIAEKLTSSLSRMEEKDKQFKGLAAEITALKKEDEFDWPSNTVSLA